MDKIFCSSLFKYLSPGQVKCVHEASLDILENVGVKVRNEHAREIFFKHGCKVDHKSLMVKIPGKIVEEFIALAPSRLTLYGRESKYDVTVPDDGPFFSTVGCAPNVVDLETGKVRLSTTKDIETIARLCNELPGIDFASVLPCVPNDKPDSYIASAFPVVKYCLKPIWCSFGGFSITELDKAMKFYALIAGSEKALYERPFIINGSCAMISPLTMDTDSTEILIFSAEKKITTALYICPTGGLTAPISLIGTLMQGNAEFLVAAIMMQMVNPGTGVIYSGVPVIADMRTGAYSAGAVETGMLVMGYAQMARYYDVPSAGYPGITNSKVVDAQAGFEKALSATASMLAGIDILHYAGLINGLMDFDFSMYVVANEISLMLKRIKKGYEYSKGELQFAVEAIKEKGPGGNFITSKHTSERMRTVPYLPELADRLPREDWEKEGELEFKSRALNRAREILSREHPGYITAEVEARINTELGYLAGD